MIGINDIQTILADSFTDGNTVIAGLILYTIALAFVFKFSPTTWHSLIIALPLTLIFGALGIISDDLLIILIVIVVLGLAWTGKSAWSKR